MKYYRVLSFPLVVVLLFASSSRCQQVFRQNTNVSNPLYSIAFPNDSLGACIGGGAELVVTTNQGNQWFEPGLTNSFGGAFYDIAFNDPETGLYVGDSGAVFPILHGDKAPRVQLPETNSIYCLSLPRYNTAVVAGAHGLAYRSVDTGKTWTKMTLPLAARGLDFHGTDYFDDITYWLVGQGGMVLYTEDAGATWQKIVVPTTSDLYSINFPDESGNGWIVGDSTLLYTTDGGDNWTSVLTSAKLRRVVGYDSLHGYACGEGGVLLATSDLKTWVSIPTGTTANLYGIDIPDSLYVCGDSGIVLTTLAPTAAFFAGNLFGETQIQMGPTPGGTVDTTDLGNPNSAWIQNGSSLPVTITKIEIDTSGQRAADPTAFISIPSWFLSELPLTVPSGANVPLPITFRPQSLTGYETYLYTVRVFSDEAGERDFRVAALAEPSPAGNVSMDRARSNSILLIESSGSSIAVQVSGQLLPGSKIELMNVLGETVATGIVSADSHVIFSPIPAGVYFCIVNTGGASQAYKIMLP